MRAAWQLGFIVHAQGKGGLDGYEFSREHQFINTATPRATLRRAREHVGFKYDFMRLRKGLRTPLLALGY